MDYTAAQVKSDKSKWVLRICG